MGQPIGWGTKGPTDEFMTAEDAAVMADSFNRGAQQNQKMEDGKGENERQTSMQSAGLNQPVANGTHERLRPPIY